MSRFAAALGAVVLIMINGPVALADPKPDAFKSAPRKVVRKDAVRIVLDDVAPRGLTSYSKNLKVTVKVYNQTSQPLAGVIVRLRAGQRFTTRSEMQTFAVDPAGDVGNLIFPSKPVTIPANGSVPVKLATKNLDGIPLQRSVLGVYPLSVVASASDGTRLAHLHTFITYAPRKPVKKTKVAYVWPLIDKPSQVTENQFLDDSLAKSVTEGGRLSTLLSAVADNSNTPVTLAIDPDLVAAVKKIGTSDYTVGKVLDEKPVPKTKSAAAQTWLAKLKEDKNKIFLTPYGDVDTVALVRSRLRRSVLKKAYGKDEQALALATLGKKEAYDHLAWPVGGVIDQKTINETAANGRDIFLLNSTELASASGLTANAASTVQTSQPKVKNNTALAYDVTLQNIISTDTRAEGAALPAELRYLAETAMITAEEPATAGTLVVAPERRWSPSPEFARSLLAIGPQNNWLKPVSLGDIAKIPASAGQKRGFMGYVKASGAELPADYLRALPEMLTHGTNFSTIFTPVDTTYERPALRAASSYWRTHPNARISAQRLSSELLTAEMSKVAVIDGDRSLAGDSGTVNLTISNSLARPVSVKVLVKTTMDQLVVGDGKKSKNGRTYFEADKKIDAGANDQISVPMAFVGLIPESKNYVPVEVVVSNLEGGVVSSVPVHIVNRELSVPGVIITIGALAVVVLGVGFRGMRARRLRKEVEDSQHGGATSVL